MSKKNKSWSLEDKLAILKEHFIEGKPVSEICDTKKLAPSLFYTWRETLFSSGFNADDKRKQRQEQNQIKLLESKLADYEAKIALKNEVIAELLEAHTKVKKSFGIEKA